MAKKEAAMELKDVFQTRRSVNFFDKKMDVSEKLLKKIYDTAKLAPSSFNLQPWKILLIKSAEGKKKLRAAAMNQPKVEEASAMVVLLADTEEYKNAGPVCDDMVAKGYLKPEAKEDYSKFPANLYGNIFAARGFALRNAGLFAMSFMLAAKDYGVDTHPMDGFEPEKIKKSFNIPDRYEVAMLIAVGYHDESKKLLPRLNRKEYEEIIVPESF